MATSETLLHRISDTLEGYKMAMAALNSPGLTWSVDLLSDYFRTVCEALDDGRPVAWINFGVPAEPFWAMDIVPVVVEVVNGIVAPTPDAIRYIDLAHETLPDYVCSSNKLFLGALLAEDLPVPQLMVHPAHPCDSNLATYPVIAETFGYPSFCIDMPYVRSDRGLDYVTGELRRLVAFLKEHTGQQLAPDRLREALGRAGAAHRRALELAALREAVPCPYSSLDNLAEYPLVLCLAGTPQLADYYERRYALTKESVEKGAGLPSGIQEQIRMVWIYGAPAYDLFLFMQLEQQYGAVAVANMNNNFVMEPVSDTANMDAMLRGLAEKVTLMPMTRECGGPWGNYVDASLELCRRYRADAAIFAGHLACKGNWGMIKLVKDRLVDELGIPVLLLELDLFDPRILGSDALMARFDEFFQLVGR